MKLSFRWYGADDKVTLENIRQIPKMEAIVTAVLPTSPTSPVLMMYRLERYGVKNQLQI